MADTAATQLGSRAVLVGPLLRSIVNKKFKTGRLRHGTCLPVFTGVAAGAQALVREHRVEGVWWIPRRLPSPKI